jgi:DNA-binding NarL/FixJ family response regulator
MKEQKIKILLADDHEYIMMGLKTYLSNFKEIEIVGICNSIKQIEEKLFDQKIIPDVLVLDYSFSDGYGEQILFAVKEKKLDTKVLVLSTYDDLALVHKLIKNGASGYVIKSDPISNISEGIYSVTHGDIYLNPSLSKKLYKYSNALTDNEIGLITRREKEILKLFVEGFSSKEIAEKLFIAEATVVTHKKNLYKKFNVPNSTGLMKEVIKHKHLL